MRILQAIIALALLGVLGVFAVGNTAPLTVHFLHYSATAPVALVAIGIYLLGMLTGWTVVSFLRRSIREATRHPTETT